MENLQWQMLRDMRTRKGCETWTHLRAPENKLRLQLLTPALIPAVPFAACNRRARTPNLWRQGGELCDKYNIEAIC